MNIKINNTATAISDAETIIGCANSFESLVSTMRTVKSNFESNWTGEESADRTSIINSLNNSIIYYESKIIPALKGLGNGVNAYAIATDELAQASVGNTSLRGMTPSEFADSNGPQGDPTVHDQSAYASGENCIGSLTQKLGDDQAKWDTLDDMYLYFREKGLTDEQIAGILGNATLESGLVLDIKNPNSTAKGLFQWLDSTWWNGERNQPSAWDLQTQLDHAWHQIETKPDASGITVLEHLNNNSLDVSGAARSFQIFFEGCEDATYARQEYANAIYTYIKNNFY